MSTNNPKEINDQELTGTGMSPKVPINTDQSHSAVENVLSPIGTLLGNTLYCTEPKSTWAERCKALLLSTDAVTQDVYLLPAEIIDTQTANTIALRGYAVTKVDEKLLGDEYRSKVAEIKKELVSLLSRNDCFKQAALALLGKIAAIEAGNVDPSDLDARIELMELALTYYNDIEKTNVPDDVTILLPGFAAEMDVRSFRDPKIENAADLEVKQVVRPGRYLISGTAALGGLCALSNARVTAKNVLAENTLNEHYQTWVEQSQADKDAIQYAPLNARLSLLSAHAVRLSLTDDTEGKNNVQSQLEAIRKQIDTLNEQGKFTPGKYEEWVACVNASSALVASTPEFKATMADLVSINLVAAIKGSSHIAHAAKFDTVYRLVLGNKLDELLSSTGQ